MLQQLFVEERTRSDGDSGLKQVRVENVGTRNYFSDSFSQKSVGALHDHPEYDRTVGMGEVNMVMNGVDFRTRHNDYKLVMPHSHSKTFGAVENIPLPGVPSSVTSKHTTAEQIQEMREYFKAFRDQDTKHRNYEPYFKPVLCYMEGYWTTDKNIREPFHSDRYTLDASSWEDLQDKIRFTSQTGLKNVNENYAHLPRVIINVNNGTPEFAQWNYDILCHPIKNDFSRKDLRIVDDLSARLANSKTLEEFSQTNAARFDIALYPGSYNGTLGYSKERAGERPYLFNKLDRIMQEIPGKDNYIGNTKDNSFGLQVCNILYTKNYTALNTGRYHRTYKVTQNGAMGTRTILRGFADRHLWSAQTTQPNYC
ncbi:hypothetical protein KUTeg_005489 [Tegillarca granosa]|uniref:Uncharacterized protein n=1 Tax=Tegillarca granosa TaxID=220873 RepID=A0ABQ9FJY1_TEGGR|nr:hypothetical protein KUTeg_005489 [Tegillarca granosa]